MISRCPRGAMQLSLPSFYISSFFLDIFTSSDSVYRYFDVTYIDYSLAHRVGKTNGMFTADNWLWSIFFCPRLRACWLLLYVPRDYARITLANVIKLSASLRKRDLHKHRRKAPSESFRNALFLLSSRQSVSQEAILSNHLPLTLSWFKKLCTNTIATVRKHNWIEFKIAGA